MSVTVDKVLARIAEANPDSEVTVYLDRAFETRVSVKQGNQTIDVGYDSMYRCLTSGCEK